MIVFACPSCQAALEVLDLSRMEVLCSHCTHVVRVPWPMVLPAPSTVSQLDLAGGNTPTLEVSRSGVFAQHLFPFLDPAQMPGEIGRLDHFRLFRVLGQGGMGIVFGGEDTHLKRPVAVKVMRPELARVEAAPARFLREARAAAAIRHPNVVTTYQVASDRDTPYLAMELLEGESLKALLRRRRNLSPAEVIHVGREIAEGLAAAHACGLIHRDLKPANVLFTETSDSPQGPASAPHCKIIDFGLAHLDDDFELTRVGAVMGTPAYVAPEQADGDAVDPRSDLFSLGCILYQACTGELPFKGKGMVSTFRAMASSPPQAPAIYCPDVSAELSRLVMRLIDLDPAGRPESAEDVAKVLRALEAEPLHQERGRQFPLIAALFLLVAVGIGLAIFPRQRRAPTTIAIAANLALPEITALVPPEQGFYAKQTRINGP